MNGATKNDRLIRFSVFEVDLGSGELFKQGRKVKLQDQPFELLVALLERPGEVLTREELRERVWPSDTAGDFDHGLNRAINKVREALGDSADSPRFIETVPRRGYRFIGSIQQERHIAAAPDNVLQPPALSPPIPETRKEERKVKPHRTFWTLIGIAAAFLVASLAVWFATRRSGGQLPLEVRQLTTNSAENPVWQAIISPDGRYLAYGGFAGIQIRLVSTGESHLLPRPRALSTGDAWFPAAWFPDGTRLLATSVQSTSDGQAINAWTVSVIGGAAAPLRENALVRSASPDGSLIAFTTGSDLRAWSSANRPPVRLGGIWVMGPRGENARRVVGGDDLTYFGSVRWSPDGKRIAYQKLRFQAGMFWEYSIENRDLNGGMPSIILSSRKAGMLLAFSFDLRFQEDFWWLPDGRVIYAAPEPPPSSRNSNLWEINVDAKSGKPQRQPRRITNLAGFHMEGLSVTADGRKLVFETGSEQSHVYVGRLEPDGKLENPRRLTLDERFNMPFAWTRDSRAVIFSSDRSGTFSIYKQALDEDVPELIPTGPETTRIVRVSPDGKWLVYMALSNVEFPDQSDFVRLMRVPLAGGAPQLIFETKNTGFNFDCPRNPERECVAFQLRADRQQRTFFSFDPVSGARHELFRMPAQPGRGVNFVVSPDGSRLAMTGTDPQGRIEIRSLTGQIENRIEVKGWPNPLTIDWAVDGKTLFVSYAGIIKSPSGPIGATLLRVDFQGHAQPLWETRGGRYTWGIASPDGRYLAIRGATTARNAWMIENF